MIRIYSLFAFFLFCVSVFGYKENALIEAVLSAKVVELAENKKSARLDFMSSRKREDVKIFSKNTIFTLGGEGVVAFFFPNVLDESVVSHIKNTSWKFDCNIRGAAGAFWNEPAQAYVDIFKTLKGDLKDHPGISMFRNLTKNQLKIKGKKVNNVAFKIKTDEYDRCHSFMIYALSDITTCPKKKPIYGASNIPRITIEQACKSEEDEGILKSHNPYTRYVYCTENSDIIIGKIIAYESRRKKVSYRQFGSSSENGGPRVFPGKKRKRLVGDRNPFLIDDYPQSEVVKKLKVYFDNLFGALFQVAEENETNMKNLYNRFETHIDGIKDIGRSCESTNGEGYFSTLVINRTRELNPTTDFHVDENVSEDSLTFLTATGNGYKGGETVFPGLISEDGKIVGVDVRERDLLVFLSGRFIHGNLELISTTKTETRRSLVFYVDERLK